MHPQAGEQAKQLSTRRRSPSKPRLTTTESLLLVCLGSNVFALPGTNRGCPRVPCETSKTQLTARQRLQAISKPLQSVFPPRAIALWRDSIQSRFECPVMRRLVVELALRGLASNSTMDRRCGAGTETEKRVDRVPALALALNAQCPLLRAQSKASFRASAMSTQPCRRQAEEAKVDSRRRRTEAFQTGNKCSPRLCTAASMGCHVASVGVNSTASGSRHPATLSCSRHDPTTFRCQSADEGDGAREAVRKPVLRGFQGGWPSVAGGAGLARGTCVPVLPCIAISSPLIGSMRPVVCATHAEALPLLWSDRSSLLALGRGGPG